MGQVWNVLAPRNLELGPLAPPPRGPAPATEETEKSGWRSFRLARASDGIAWLVIDKPGTGANTLSEDILTELDDVLAKLEADRPKGLVLRSAKPAGFIAGADIGEFRSMTDPSAVEARLASALAVLDRLDRLPLPTVAVIHGYCLGGGLEVALACDYRIAVEDARLGLPEVMLGLHPGLGGTVRLPRLINPLEAMTAMLTGRNLRAGRARSLGLVDAVVPERHVAAAAAAAVGGKLRSNRGRMLVSLLNTAPGRRLAARRMRSETARRAPIDHYPAPHALIDIWENHGGNPREMQKAETASFAHLVTTDTSRNLVRVFFLREKLKGLADGAFDGRRVHVIGAGAMGGDIAAWCAWHGFTVTLADMKTEPLAGATARAAELYGKIGHKRTDIRDALDRLIPDRAGEGVRVADLVIEAVPEVLDVKRAVYGAIEPKMKPGAILATNTSSIPLEELRAGLARPDRLVGLHFFNPVSRMQVVEVVSHDQVSPAVVERCTRVPRPHRPPAGPGQEHAGLPGQPGADPLHARGHGDAQPGHQARDHRCRRGRVRHAGGSDRARRHGRARHLPQRGADAHRTSRPPVARSDADAARQGRGRRARPQDREGHLPMEGRRRGQGRRRSGAGAGDDGPPDPADARRLRRLPAPGGGGGRGDRRRRHDLRHRVSALPRRSHALYESARRGRHPPDALGVLATLW